MRPWTEPCQIARPPKNASHSAANWRSVLRGARANDRWVDRLRHIAYAGGWKKCEPLWDLAIRARRVTGLLPVLEQVLSG